MSDPAAPTFASDLAALRERGRARRATVLGAEYAATTDAAVHPYVRELFDHFLATGWGTVWNRPHLSLRERSLVTLAASAASGRCGEVKAHTRGAYTSGASPEEIREVVIQVAAYCGIGLAGEAIDAVLGTLQELGADLGE